MIVTKASCNLFYLAMTCNDITCSRGKTCEVEENVPKCKCPPGKKGVDCSEGETLQIFIS